jgi:hypothetical protein
MKRVRLAFSMVSGVGRQTTGPPKLNGSFLSLKLNIHYSSGD